MQELPRHTHETSHEGEITLQELQRTIKNELESGISSGKGGVLVNGGERKGRPAEYVPEEIMTCDTSEQSRRK